MDILLIVIALAIMVAVFALVLGLRGRPSSAMAKRLQTFREERQAGETLTPEEGPLLKKRSYSGLPVLSGILGQFAGTERVALQLERAGVPLRVGEYYVIRYLAAILFFSSPFIFARGAFAVLLGIGMAVLGYSLPAVWLGSKMSARSKRLNAQLVELLGMVANSLKSGYGTMQSFEFAAKQLDPPMAVELRRMLRDANLGMTAEEALRAMGDRIDSPDLEIVLTAINIQNTVGGNLAEILEGVAFTMRERERIRGDIATLTSQQRMTGIIIGGLPIGMGLLFLIINPDYMGLLFTTTAGRVMLLLAAVLEFLGVMSMRKILAIEI